MGLPIAVALCGVGAGVGLTMLLSAVYAVPDFTPTVGVMIGLGVGIDYALFIVTRFRQGLHEGRSPREATLVAMSTAGRAVIFAGITVVISLLGMLIIGIRMVSGMGIGASVTVGMTMVSSLTLLPALLGVARERVEVTRWRGLVAAALVAGALLGAGLGVPPLAAAGAILALLTLLASVAVRPLRGEVPRRALRPVRETSAYRWSRTIQRNPWRWVGVGGIGLVLLAAPLASLRLGVADEGRPRSCATACRTPRSARLNASWIGRSSPVRTSSSSRATSTTPRTAVSAHSCRSANRWSAWPSATFRSSSFMETTIR
jgi:RND superfamily putative drug exporter